MQTVNPEETLDLGNDNNEVIGTISRAKVYAEGTKMYRVVYAVIKSDQGKLWIPHRVATKKLFSNALDYSVAGHVEAGETYEQALVRETNEEVGIDLATTSYRELTHLSPVADGVCAWQRVYEISHNDTPDYDTSEFPESFWLTPREVVVMIEGGDSAKSDLGMVDTKVLW